MGCIRMGEGEGFTFTYEVPGRRGDPLQRSVQRLRGDRIDKLGGPARAEDVDWALLGPDPGLDLRR